MSRMLERIRAAQKRQEETSTSSSKDENIFFDLTEGTHTVRLVGEWVTIHSHWIGNSKYTQVELFPDSAFEGENRLKKNICCADFDIDTELPKEDKTCVMCRLRKEANKMIFDDKLGLSKEQKDLLGKISYEARPSERYFFLCIDRDNPEISPGSNGLKIIEFPMPLMKHFFSLVESNSDIDIVSPDDGVDLKIEKKKETKGYSYNLSFVMKGRSVSSSPLTEEELNYKKHDIKRIMGKLPNQMAIYEGLNDDYRDMIDTREFEVIDTDEEQEEAPPPQPLKKESKKPSSKIQLPTQKKREELPEDEDEEEPEVNDEDQIEDDGDIPF